MANDGRDCEINRYAPRKASPFIALAVVAAAMAILLVLGFSVRVGCGLPMDSAPCTRVLFIGNSYTSVNDLPSVFANLARSGGHRVEALESL
jgi:hypothetical protein